METPQSLCGPLPVIDHSQTCSFLFLFSKYMTTKRVMQWKSSVWDIWKSNENRMTFLALIIPCYKQVVTSWLRGSGKCHNIHDIFTSSLLQNGLFLPSPFNWMEKSRKGLGWFLQSVYSFPIHSTESHMWLKEEEKALAAYTNETETAEAEFSLLHTTRTFPMIMGKSLNF